MRRRARAVTVTSWASPLTVALGIHLAPASASAAVSDQVLPALASVVKDRAEQVAARQIVVRLQNSLCNGSAFVDAGITFQLGKTCAGAESDKVHCIVLFEQTCRLLAEIQPGLQDPILLRAFRDDLVRGAVRVAGRGLRPDEWNETLGAFEEYVIELVTLLTRDTITIADVAAITALFAEQSSSQSTVKALLAQYAKALIDSKGAREIARRFETKDIDAPGVVKEILSEAPRGGEARCTTDLALAQRAVDKMFNDETGEFRRASNAECSATYPRDDQCKAAQLLRLWVTMEQTRCSIDDPSASLGEVEQAFGKLTYVFLKPQIYTDAGEVLKKPFPTFTTAVTDIVSARDKRAAAALRQVDTSLVWAGRLLSAVVSAGSHREQARNWLAALRADMTTLVAAPNLEKILQGKALAETTQPLPKGIEVLRQTIRSFLIFKVASSGNDLTVSRAAARQLVRLVAAFQRLTETLAGSEPDPRAAVELTARVLNALAELSNPDATNEQVAVRVMKQSAKLIEDIAAGNYVWIPVQLADGVADKWPDLSGALRFGRVLLSAYQADSKEEAEAVFRSALSDEASRERRYRGLTFDAGAIVGGRGGLLWNDGLGRGDPKTLSGLFAPFGLILAYKWVGLIVYPVDLGGYLLAEGGGGSVELRDAVRLGVDLYARPFESVPISIGAGVSYVPPNEPASGKRFAAAAWVGIDLPMYVLR